MQSPTIPTIQTPLHDYGMEIKRLRRMKAKKRLIDATKIAHLWTKLRSRNYRKEWVRARAHWFQMTSLDALVEQNLARYVQQQNTFRDQFIDFDEELHMMKVDFNYSRGEACEVA